MDSEQKINKEIASIYETFENTLPRKNSQVVNAIDKIRLTISDVLAQYADENGKIPKGRINTVMTELASIEGEIYRNSRDALKANVNDASLTTVTTIMAAVVGVLGVAAITRFAGLNKAIATLGAQSVAILFSALTKSSYSEFSESITDSIFNRKADDGKRLIDRLRLLAKDLHTDITALLRKSIRNGESTPAMLQKVAKRIKDTAWRYKTIVLTELQFAFRQTTAWLAEKTGLVDALRIVDHLHGAPGVHERHKCYIYARSDEYGLGKGVYPVSVQKIRHPHPQCRSTLFFVLNKRLKGAS